jgi:hypothetical protein
MNGHISPSDFETTSSSGSCRKVLLENQFSAVSLSPGTALEQVFLERHARIIGKQNFLFDVYDLVGHFPANGICQTIESTPLREGDDFYKGNIPGQTDNGHDIPQDASLFLLFRIHWVSKIS